MNTSTASTEQLVLADVDGSGVLTLTLNRPEVMNAWIPPMQSALFDALDAAAGDPAVRVVVLTGAGRGFCPGVDMAYLADLSSGTAGGAGGPRDTRRITHALSLPKPVVCAINGACAGIGLALAMSCDIRFAASDAKLTTAFAKLGLVAEHGLSWTLPQACGVAVAKELLLTSRRFTGEEAARLGVVHGALPSDELLAHTRDFARQLVHGALPSDELLAHTRDFARQLATQISPVSFAAMKWQLARAPLQTIDQALDDADELMAQTVEGPDFREGVAAFSSRRDPAFAPLGQGTTVEYPTDEIR